MNHITVALTAATITGAITTGLLIRHTRHLNNQCINLETETETIHDREMELLDLLAAMPNPPGYSAVEMEGWVWAYARWRNEVLEVLVRQQSVASELDKRNEPSMMPRPLR